LLFLTVSNIQSQTIKTAANSGLLYEISGKNLKKPSYLFGTIHLICAKDMFATEKMKGYIDQTKQIMLEFDLDDKAVIQKALGLSMLKDGKSVKEYLTAQEYARLDSLYKNYLGMSFDVLQRFKPMISGTFLLTSPKVLGCQPPTVYDNYLAQTAAVNKMPVIGLETAEEQIAVIDSEPLDQQIKALNAIGSNPQKGIAEFQALYKLYLTQDSDALYALAAAQLKAEGYSQSKMLDNRNQKWIPAIEKNIAEKPTFIAVGAAHLGGKNGVIRLLRARGYKLTPIKL
ncbi:MAG: TraB/GumN family protein, partial [Acidobacteriota bacterium]|nr:TraB/GumN family protein [Acidobacteriota bacterium]